MKKPLLEVLFMSEKRKGVLLLLQDGEKEMKFLLSTLNTTRQALLPQIRILEEHYLVSHSKDSYELTMIGKLIVDNMASVLNIVEALDIDYWGNHDISFMPPHLLKRIDEIGKCELINPLITDIYAFNNQFHGYSRNSKYVYMITSVYHPDALELIADLISNNINFYLISSSELHDRVMKEKYSEVVKLTQNKLAHLFVYPKTMPFQFISFNECHIMLSLLKNNGEPDINYILCESKNALEWGKELFEYYLKDSTPVTDL